MRLKLLFFAGHRDITGVASITMEMPQGATVRDLYEKLAERHPALHGMMGRTIVAVNRDQAGWERELNDGDEVAFYPPVSGG
jgi:molybdopterin converting factor subunit 1